MIARLLLVALSICSVAVRADDAVKVPKGVHYKPTTARINEQATDLIRNRFSSIANDETVISMFDSMLICGPGLWKDLKADKSLSGLKKGRVTFLVPVLDKDGKVIRTNKLEGKLFQSRDELLLFWKAFIRDKDFTDLKIRKLNEREIAIFWAMISFDITEPLFVVEIKNHRILVTFTAPDKLKIAWMDDFQNMEMKEPDAKK